MDASHVYVRALALRLLLQSYQYPNLSEGADRVGGQLRGDKECPFSGVSKSGRVWRNVPESDTRSVVVVVVVVVAVVVVAVVNNNNNNNIKSNNNKNYSSKNTYNVNNNNIKNNNSKTLPTLFTLFW